MAEAEGVHEEVGLALTATFRGVAFITVRNICITWLAERGHGLLAVHTLQLIVRISALRSASDITVQRAIAKLIFARNTLHQIVIIDLVFVETLHVLVSDASALCTLNAKLTVVV